MQILVNTDEKMKGGEDQSARVAADIHARLDRFSTDRICRHEEANRKIIRLPRDSICTDVG